MKELTKGLNIVEAEVTETINGIKKKVTKIEEINITDIYPEQICKHCKKKHTIYKCIKKTDFDFGNISKLIKFTIEEKCYYCQETKAIYMTAQDIEENRKTYTEALNKEISRLETEGDVYVVFRHYMLTNKGHYTNSIQIGMTNNYDEAIDIIRRDKKLFLKYANKEMSEITDTKNFLYYTGGKAPKRFTYSISLGCSFIADGENK